MPLHYGRAVAIAGGTIIVDYFKWMRKYAKHPEKYPFDKRYKDVRKLLNIRGVNICIVNLNEKIGKPSACSTNLT